MMNISNEYIILIWIIGLVLFTFYCVFRLKYISEKYADIQIPYSTRPNNIISYINKIQSEDKILDIPGCETMYDDNYRIKGLGYNNCNEGYIDYLKNNYDVNKKYDGINSLANVCPVTAKSAKYSECLKLLLNKFTNNASILENINKEMGESINKRLETRNINLYNTELALNSFINSKELTEFNNNMLINNQIPKYNDDKLRLVDNYYQDKYRDGIEQFTSQKNNNNNNNYNNNYNLSNDKFTNIVDPDIETKYFGKYKPIRGQFLALDDLIISIEYDNVNNSKNNNNNNATKNKLNNETDETYDIIDKPVIFTISNNDLFIVYQVYKIDMYKLRKNAVTLILKDKRVINQTNDTSVIEPLLHILGLYTPASITIVFDESVSTEGITHTMYKLVNANFDTILVLEKLT